MYSLERARQIRSKVKFLIGKKIREENAARINEIIIRDRNNEDINYEINDYEEDHLLNLQGEAFKVVLIGETNDFIDERNFEDYVKEYNLDLTLYGL